MRNMKCISLFWVAAALLLAGCGGTTDVGPRTELWYKQPAGEWMESLPIGNGRLGAMTYGGIQDETISLNESTLWSGEYNENQNKPFGREKLNELRKLFFAGKLSEGNRMAGDNMAGMQTTFGTHLPIGDLKMHFSYPEGEITDYRRALNLNKAISEVTYKVGEVQYKREYFATNPDEVLVLRLSADKPEALTLNLSLDLLREADITTEDDQLMFTGKVDFPLHGKGGVSFEGRIAVAADNGSVKADSKGIHIDKANAVTLTIDVRTDFDNPEYKSLCAETVKKANAKPYETVKAAHIKDYSALYNRVEMNLGAQTNDTIPTDIRWKQVREEGKSDTALDALFFQYGRYLVIASSRENSPLPIALQGFFNDNQACNMGWTNDYHLDINTEQNYWIANVGNLAECNAPLFNYIKHLSVHGAKTAEVVYGCKGWTAHTTANVWGYTPASSTIIWGLFPTAGSWMATHLWSNYEYTQDKKYLAEVAYPLLKGNAEFLLDYMVENPNNGYLVTGPSISPENWFRVNGEDMVASMMPTCDRELAYEIFNACIQSSAILGVDKAFSDSLKLAMTKLPPIQLRANGAIREWFEDYEESHPNHRHTSHLLALYPFSQITLEKTPELAAGAHQTIKDRLSAKDWEDTEWSRANMICFYARLKDPVNAYNSIRTLQGKLSRENLLTVSPGGIAGAPNDIYSFDGNSAGAAGMAEMLVQNHEGYVEFLPCLPDEWKDGSFKGLCIRGGAEVSAAWTNGVIDKASLKATADNQFTVEIPQGKTYKVLLNGKEINGKPDAKGLLSIEMKKNDLMEIN